MAYNLLKGKKGIIFGALNESSIATKVALKVKEEGAEIILTNTKQAMRLGNIKELTKICNAEFIPSDATSIEDLENLYSKSLKILGGKVDFILHSVGMSPNLRKKNEYRNINYDWFLKTLDVSAISFHKIMQVADKMNIMNEYGSILAISYIASQRYFSHYGDMSQAKAVLESIARSYGYHFAKSKKVRVNTLCQSPVMTTAGQGVPGFDVFSEFSELMSPLGNASAEAMANYSVTLFSDLTRMVTMQNLFHDGGFSTTGITHEMEERLTNSL